MSIPNYPCEKDALKVHCWKLLGVIPFDMKVFKIWECQQCKEAVWEEVEFIYQRNNMPERR